MRSLKKLLFFNFVTAAVLITEAAYATPVCPYLERETYELIDSALPCVNFDIRDLERRPAVLVPSMRRGIFTELSRRNFKESNCRRNAFAQINGSAEQKQSLMNSIKDRFKHLRTSFRALRSADAQDTATSMGAINAESGRGAHGEPTANDIRMRRELTNRQNDRTARLSRLASNVPFGFEPLIRDAMLQLDRELPENFQETNPPQPEDPAVTARFEQILSQALAQTQSAYQATMDHFQGLWRVTECAEQLPDSVMSHAYSLDNPDPNRRPVRTCPNNWREVGGLYTEDEGTWKAFSEAGAIQELADSAQIRTDSSARVARTRLTMVCNGDPYRERRENLENAAIGLGIGCVIPGVGALVCAGIAGVVYGNEIINSCFNTSTGFRVVSGQSCTQSGGFTIGGAVHAAESTNCAQDIVAGTVLTTAALAGAILPGGRAAVETGLATDVAESGAAGIARVEGATGRAAIGDAGRAEGAGARTLAGDAGRADRAGSRVAGAGERTAAGTAERNGTATAANVGEDTVVTGPSRIDRLIANSGENATELNGLVRELEAAGATRQEIREAMEAALRQCTVPGR